MYDINTVVMQMIIYSVHIQHEDSAKNAKEIPVQGLEPWSGT